DGIRDRTVTGVQTCALPIFYALCAAVCLAVLFITIAGTLLLSSGGAWLLRRYAGRIEPAVLSNLLFAVRLLPLMLALFLVIGFRSEERRVGKECRSRWALEY